MSEEQRGTSESKSPEGSAYDQWLARFDAVFTACRSASISDEDKLQYQLHLLCFGQFNATFTCDELNELKYPKSPFIVSGRRTYQRSTDTWAMEMLAQKYLEVAELRGVK